MISVHAETFLAVQRVDAGIQYIRCPPQAELDRERRTFESLIRQKEFMLVPVTAAGEQLVQGQKTVTAADVGTNARTRRAGGRASKPTPCRVVVDVREFMSSLPSVLHQQGMQLVPMQLEVWFLPQRCFIAKLPHAVANDPATWMHVTHHI